MILLWMVFSLCRLFFVAEPQALMAYCRWKYTRLKYTILSQFVSTTLEFYKIYQNSKKACFQALKYEYPSLVYYLSAFQDILLN